MIAALAVLLLLPVRAGAETQGVTDDSVLVGSYQALSGPQSIVSLVGKGADAYFKMVNEKGGINGRKINFIMEDDQYQVARTVAAVKKFVERDRVFALVGGMNTAGVMATIQYTEQKKVLQITGMASSKFLFPPMKYGFSVRPASYVTGLIMANYALDKLGAKRIGIFYYDSSYGLDTMDGLMKVFKERGVEPVAKAAFTSQDVEFSSQALLLKDAKPDTVILVSSFRDSPRLLTEAEKIGFKPTFFGITENNTPVLLKLAGKAAEGVVMPSSLPQPNSDMPQMAEYRKAFSQYYPKENAFNSLPMIGWSAAMTFGEALKRAGRDVTPDKMVEALESIKNWDGGLAYRLTFAPDRRDGQRALRMCQVKEGKIVQIEDFIEIDKVK